MCTTPHTLLQYLQAVDSRIDDKLVNSSKRVCSDSDSDIILLQEQVRYHAMLRLRLRKLCYVARIYLLIEQIAHIYTTQCMHCRSGRIWFKSILPLVVKTSRPSMPL